MNGKLRQVVEVPAVVGVHPGRVERPCGSAARCRTRAATTSAAGRVAGRAARRCRGALDRVQLLRTRGAVLHRLPPWRGGPGGAAGTVRPPSPRAGGAVSGWPAAGAGRRPAAPARGWPRRLGERVGRAPGRGWAGLREQLAAGRGQLGVDAAPVVGAEDPGEQPALLEPGDQPGGRAAGERGGAGELLHPHVPAVLAGERVEHRELDDGQVVAGLRAPAPEPVSISPCRAARVRQPCARTSTASSAIPMRHSSGDRRPRLPRLHRYARACNYSLLTRCNCTRACAFPIGRPVRTPESPMPLGLIALAIGAFGIGLTEFVIMGLLPEVAADFGVTDPGRRLPDLRLRARRRRRRARPDRRGHPAAAQAGAARPDGALHRRQPALRARRRPTRVLMAGRIVAALVPRRVLRHRLGGRRRPGRAGPTGAAPSR